MLATPFRLKRGNFDFLIKEGRTLSTDLFSVRYASFNRKAASVVVAKKIAPLAVSRSKARRRVYEALRGVWTLFPPKTAVAFFLRKDCLNAPHKKLQVVLKEVIKKIS